MLFFHICSYSNCCFLCAASRIVVFVYLQGSFRSFLYIFNNICDLVLLFKKNSLRHPFHYLLIKMFYILCTNRQGLPVNFVNLIFNVLFYVALKSLCISNVLTFFFIYHVLINFAKLTENT